METAIVRVDYLTADGKTLKITVTFDENEVIPNGAKLEVQEIQEGDEGWGDRSARFAGVLSEKYGNVTISDVRFLNISIMADGKEFEPKAPVEVKIEYTDSLYSENTQETFVDPMIPEPIEPYGDDHFVMVHYTNDGVELLDSEIRKTDDGIVESVATTSSFSEYDVAFVYEYDAPEAGTDSSFGTIGGNYTADKVTSLLSDTPTLFAAAPDGTPIISKTLGNNGDGTYLLGLSVTGDAQTTSTSSPVNVVIVYDVSTSMTGNRIPSATGAYGIQYYDNFDGVSDGNYFQLYKRVNGSYSAVTDAEEYTGTVYRRTGNQWGYSYTEYTGQRHHASITRADAGEKVVYDFTHALFGYQDQTDPSNIQVSLVTFSRTATIRNRTNANPGGWTSNESTITNLVSNTGTSHKLSYSSYTNWEAAMYQAYNVVNSADNDPTYVVFITDGQPTESNYSGQYTGTNVSGNAGNDDYRRALNEARLVEQACEGKGGNLYSIYAYGKAADWLASLTYYAYNGSRPASNIEGTTFSTTGYYNASDTAALTNAINEIFSKIVDTLGIGQASIHDGTTSSVTTTTGEISDLLEVDDTTFQYWLSWKVTAGQNGTYTFTMPDKYNKNNGNDITYTASVSGGNVTLSWSEAGTARTASYKGTIQNNVLTVEWTAATAFYNLTPPTATYNDSTGAVDWNLNSLGTLLDGVEYKVTFEVYPSQTTLDLIADLKNGYVEYDNLDANIKKYLSEDYQLKTNTSATLTYTDTRTDDGEQTKDFIDPDPVGVSAAKELAVSKKWNNTLDSRDNWKAETITLWVTRDGTERYPITMNAENDWSGSAYISYGTLTRDADGTVHLKTTGHDYSYAESIDVSYNWEIEVPTVRPMLINSVETMLVLVDAADAPAAITGATADNAYAHAEGGDYYKLTINGKVEYYKVDTAMASLTAINHRRSYLDVTKTVTGNNVPDGDKFAFNMTVTTNVEGADPDNYNSDAWVWFDVYDTSARAIVKDVNLASATGIMYEYTDTGDAETYTSKGVGTSIPAGSYFDGYFCVPSGTQITVQMQKGYSLRFLNLPVGATYTIAESSTLPDGYTFVSIVGTRSFDADQDETTTNDWTTESEGTVSGQSISGTIEYVESAYKAAFTNKWSTIDVQLKKVDENGDLLGGSTFTLSMNDTELDTFQPGDTAETNPISFGGVGIGLYKLEETGIPDGYLKADDVYFQVYKDTDNTLKARLVDSNGNVLSDQSAISSVTGSDGTIYTITIENEPSRRQVTILKTSEVGKTSPLGGAKFDLYTKEGYEADPKADPVKTGVESSNADATKGQIDLGELDLGDYYLVETKAPDGYNLLEGAISLHVETDKISIIQGSSQRTDNTPDDDDFDAFITNNSGVELPHTGGPGNYLNYLGGFALLLTAAVMYGFRMRRRERRYN